AAAKVRRWIKELQINVSEHRGDKAKPSIHLKSVSNGASCSAASGWWLYGVSRESPLRIRFQTGRKNTDSRHAPQQRHA
ncbi:hypothetical protein ACIOZM_31715, partial [Pseudomonas sp. NPDC087346]|uniref:hypothetical protein n=1 Tax=Pseudomonas sp. NPDC087346 TaxID=3364438 RepID=UPI0037F674D2